jgi:hypothetical protein
MHHQDELQICRKQTAIKRKKCWLKCMQHITAASCVDGKDSLGFDWDISRALGGFVGWS